MLGFSNTFCLNSGRAVWKYSEQTYAHICQHLSLRYYRFMVPCVPLLTFAPGD